MLYLEMDENEDKLHKIANIFFNIKCDVCGHELVFKTNCDEILVLPCQNCISAGYVKTHEKLLESANQKHNDIIAKELEIQTNKIKNMEEKIYKKFEERFRNFLKGIEK